MTDYMDLAKRAVACEGWRWMRGMVAVTASGAHFLRGTDTWEWDDHGALPGGPPQSEIAALLAGELLPDFDDAATLGCLLALVREKHGDPCAHIVCVRDFDGDFWFVARTNWRTMLEQNITGRYHRAEAEALVAALEVKGSLTPRAESNHKEHSTP